MSENLHSKFERAYKLASETKIKLPADIMLQLYAFYKQATKGNNYQQPSGENQELRNAFKLNAWFQLNRFSEEEAKRYYIELVEKHLKLKKEKI